MPDSAVGICWETTVDTIMTQRDGRTVGETIGQAAARTIEASAVFGTLDGGSCCVDIIDSAWHFGL